MHSFLQRKLKNLHGEARVWGSSTPRPPPLIVQPKGGLSSAAGSRVHGARVPGGQGAGARGRSAAGAAAGQGERRKCRSAGGSPGVAGGAATPRQARTWLFGTSRRKRQGCGWEGEWTGHAGYAAVGRCPFPGAGARRNRDGVPSQPWPSRSGGEPAAPSRLSAPAAQGCGAPRRAPRGPAQLARKAALPRAARLPRATPAWESGGREAPAGRAGPWRLRSVRSDSREPGWGWGGAGEAGMWNKESSWVWAKRAKVCLGAARMWESGHLDFLIRALWPWVSHIPLWAQSGEEDVE